MSNAYELPCNIITISNNSTSYVFNALLFVLKAPTALLSFMTHLEVNAVKHGE